MNKREFYASKKHITKFNVVKVFTNLTCDSDQLAENQSVRYQFDV